MIWGYAGCYPGEFNIWKGDELMNRLKFAAEHGFRSTGIGLSVMDDPARRDQVGKFVADHDLMLTVGFHAKFFDSSLDELRRQSDRFLESLALHGPTLRTPIVTTGAGPYHRFMRKPGLTEQLDRLCEAFTPLAKACHEMGRPLGIENHGDYYCQDLVDLCRRTPYMHIFLDTGNTYLIGEQSVPACRAAAPYVIGTHFKDHCVHPDPGKLTFVIEGAPLGQGDVGLREIYMDLIKLAPNPGKLILQWEMVAPKDMNPWKCLEESWQFVKTLPEADK